MKYLPQNRSRMFTAPTMILLLTGLSTALIAGLFYAYSCSVNPGLGSLKPDIYIAAMQSINKAIQNPLFFLSFMGTALLLPVCTYMHYRLSFLPKFYWLLAATIFYLVGVMGVTMFGNVPLNNTLDKLDPANADTAELLKQKLFFMTAWNRFHAIRTVAAFFSLLFVLIACIQKDAE